MSRRLRAITAAAAAVALAACGPTALPNFGALEPDARTLNVKNNVRMLELSNGMQVALVPDDRTNLVSVDVRYRVGANQDPAGRAGLAHLVEHLTFQAAGRRPRHAAVRSSFVAVALGSTRTPATTSPTTRRRRWPTASTRCSSSRRGAWRRRARRSPTAAFVRERDVVVEQDAARVAVGRGLLGEIDRAVWGTATPTVARWAARGRPGHQGRGLRVHRRYYTPNARDPGGVGNVDPARSAAHRPAVRPISRTSTRRAADPIAPARLAGTPHSKHTGDVEHPTAVIVPAGAAVGRADEASTTRLDAVARHALAELDAATRGSSTSTSATAVDAYQRVTLVRVEVETSDGSTTRWRGHARRAGPADEPDRDGNADDNDDYRRPRRRRPAHRSARRVAGRRDHRHDRFGWQGDAIADYLTFTDHRDFAIARMRAADALTGNSSSPTPAGAVRCRRAPTSRGRPRAARASGPRPRVAPSPPARTTCRCGARRSTRPPRRAPSRCRPPRRRWRSTTFRLANGLRVLLYAEPAQPGFEARLVFPTGTATSPPASRRRGLAATLLDHDYDREYPRRSTRATIAGRCAGTPGSRRSATRSSRPSPAAAWRPSATGTCGGWRGCSIRASTRRRPRRVADARSRASRPRSRRRPRSWRSGNGCSVAQHPYAQAPARRAARSPARSPSTGWRRTQLDLDGATLIVSGGFDPAAMHRRRESRCSARWRAPATARAAQPAPAPIGRPGWLGDPRSRRAPGDADVHLVAASDRVAIAPPAQVLAAMVDRSAARRARGHGRQLRDRRSVRQRCRRRDADDRDRARPRAGPARGRGGDG
jgi:zinc protease